MQHSKRQLHFFTGAKHRRMNFELQRVFHLVGNAEHQLHPTARAKTRFIGANVLIHRAHVILRRGGRDGCGGLLGILVDLRTNDTPTDRQEQCEKNPHTFIIARASH
jgi:hypothetical protein